MTDGDERPAVAVNGDDIRILVTRFGTTTVADPGPDGPQPTRPKGAHPI
jgi:hypothetical protein